MTSTTPEAPVTSQYDNLTLDDLREFHHQLCQRHTALHYLMMEDDGVTARVSPLGDEWAELSTEADWVNGAADDLYREICRRESEPVEAEIARLRAILAGESRHA